MPLYIFVLDQSRQYENNSCSAPSYPTIIYQHLLSLQFRALSSVFIQQSCFIMTWRRGCLILLVVLSQVSSEVQDLSNGWGSDYAWEDSLEAAQNKAKLQWKWVLALSRVNMEHNNLLLITSLMLSPQSSFLEGPSCWLSTSLGAEPARNWNLCLLTMMR